MSLFDVKLCFITVLIWKFNTFKFFFRTEGSWFDTDRILASSEYVEILLIMLYALLIFFFFNQKDMNNAVPMEHLFL